MKRFALQYSEDGRKFIRVGSFCLDTDYVRVVKTFYFEPVEAIIMRIVLLEGQPNIKFEFYYSKNTTEVSVVDYSYEPQGTYAVVEEGFIGQNFNPNASCGDKELCWMGLQLCEPKEIYGFVVENSSDDGQLLSVYLQYSVDGVKF